MANIPAGAMPDPNPTIDTANIMLLKDYRASTNMAEPVTTNHYIEERQGSLYFQKPSGNFLLGAVGQPSLQHTREIQQTAKELVQIKSTERFNVNPEEQPFRSSLGGALPQSTSMAEPVIANDGREEQQQQIFLPNIDEYNTLEMKAKEYGFDLEKVHTILLSALLYLYYKTQLTSPACE